VDDANAYNDAEGGVDDGVPWDAWGPRATTVSDDWHTDRRYVLGERRATTKSDPDRICIRDYNPY
jgi:hypothetical protein